MRHKSCDGQASGCQQSSQSKKSVGGVRRFAPREIAIPGIGMSPSVAVIGWYQP